MAEMLPYVGHRNWIAVVDSAYPLQIGGGVEMVCAEEDIITVLEHVSSTILTQEHISAIALVDNELDYLEENDCPGISSYRQQLDDILRETTRLSQPHEQIIAAIDEAATRFRVLVIKAKHLLPYTSVFFRLECGYWDEARESRLRSHLHAG